MGDNHSTTPFFFPVEKSNKVYSLIFSYGAFLLRQFLITPNALTPATFFTLVLRTTKEASNF